MAAKKKPKPKRDPVLQFLSEIGRKGGKATGTVKVRGDSEYYSQLSKRKTGSKRKGGQSDAD